MEMFKGFTGKTKFAVFLALCCFVLMLTAHWNYQILSGQYMNMSANYINKKTIKYTPVCSHAKNFSCDKVLAGDTEEIKKGNQLMLENFRSSLLPEVYPAFTKDCQRYRQVRNYINISMSDGERQFPIAFSLLVYKHAEQVERLLRAIWRSQNVYCVHVDIKSTNSFREAIKSISKCFDNIILLPNPVDVRWGTFTVLEPELLCMDVLWKHKTKWKYFINLTGQEFPLKTNYELYRILQSYNGANDIEGAVRGANLERWRGRGDPPHKIKPRKGSVHITASRAFVDYLLHNKTAQDLLQWAKKTAIPDETYFATLNNNPHLQVPGSYKGDADDGLHWMWNRYKIWSDASKCSGMFVREICIFSVGDLKRLTTSPFLFANKFFYEYHHLAYDCIESWFYKKVVMETEGHLDFNTSIYKNRRIVSHHF